MGCGEKDAPRSSKAWLKKCKSFWKKRKAATSQTDALSAPGSLATNTKLVRADNPLSLSWLVISGPLLQHFELRKKTVWSQKLLSERDRDGAAERHRAGNTQRLGSVIHQPHFRLQCPNRHPHLNTRRLRRPRGRSRRPHVIHVTLLKGEARLQKQRQKSTDHATSQSSNHKPKLWALA